MTTEISKDEAAIYDRQIRLWGLDAQQRIGKASILVAGMRALSDEVCKNIALAGVASVTLLDHETVTEFDLGAQFFLTEASVGQNKAEAAAASIRNLNPRVQVIVDQQDIREKQAEYFESFSAVCLIHSEYDLISKVDKIRRDVKKPFYAADAFGWFGYIFCDLTEHAYIQEKKSTPHPNSKAQPTVEKIQHVETYSSLDDSLQKNWSDMRIKALKRRVSPLTFLMHMLFKFQRDHHRSPTNEDAQYLIENKAKYLADMGIDDTSVLDDRLLNDLASLFDTEISPVAAIVGGILAQDILRTLSANELPIQNWFYYNGVDGKCVL
ncbi:SUMO-activating enzyme subunit 1 isoform X2 [Mucor ambiguus]|uniref:Ubiquitin-like 1-activating enzyme E1A n=1 Tax=Mucor ambiguus TaxID=91626 RepID=A0A0C9MTA6_9FUNG|nr:SUMO-activating enzyme subunit 1 isoform X2 [Mucor ambiguus]